MGTSSTARWETFPEETLVALFDAVEVNDVIAPDADLPGRIVIGTPPDCPYRCYSLVRQFWCDAVVRRDVAALLRTLARTGDLDPDQRRRYKHIRARCKQLRFAMALYGARHHEPAVFGLTVRVMGSLQDAFRRGDRSATRRYVLALRTLVTRPAWAAVAWQATALRLDTADGVRAFRMHEITRLRGLLARPRHSGRAFHEMRKIVSREVAFYDHSRTLRPEDRDARRMSRYLATLNGLMGARHDEMVRQDHAGERGYREALPLPPGIRARLEAFVAAWPA